MAVSEKEEAEEMARDAKTQAGAAPLQVWRCPLLVQGRHVFTVCSQYCAKLAVSSLLQHAVTPCRGPGTTTGLSRPRSPPWQQVSMDQVYLPCISIKAFPELYW